MGGDAPVLRADSEALLDILGISAQALSALKARGIAVDHGRNAWNLTATVRGYIAHLRETASGRGGEEYVATLTAERARLAREQADGQALKNAALRGELVEASAVERAWSDLLRQVQARVLAVPSRLRADLGLEAATAEALDRELRNALEALGRGDG